MNSINITSLYKLKNFFLSNQGFAEILYMFIHVKKALACRIRDLQGDISATTSSDSYINIFSCNSIDKGALLQVNLIDKGAFFPLQSVPFCSFSSYFPYGPNFSLLLRDNFYSEKFCVIFLSALQCSLLEITYTQGIDFRFGTVYIYFKKKILARLISQQSLISSSYNYQWNNSSVTWLLTITFAPSYAFGRLIDDVAMNQVFWITSLFLSTLCSTCTLFSWLFHSMDILLL